MNEQYILQDSILATVYDDMIPDDIPFYAKFNMAVEGHIRLCKRIFAQHYSSEGSCLHVKTGALLSFQVKSNMRTAKELVYMVQFAMKSADCGQKCLDDGDCQGFMFYHKVDGEPKMDDNCVFVNLPEGFDSSGDLIRVDGQLDVVDFYERVYLSNATDTGGRTIQRPQSSANSGLGMSFMAFAVCILASLNALLYRLN